MKYSARTDIGKKYDHNEDTFVLPETNKKYNIKTPDVKNKGKLFILCDGIGGANAGEVASELTANWIFRDYYSVEDTSIDLTKKLKEIIELVNTKIYNLTQEYENYKGMGTTIASLLFIHKKAYIYSVGDSRVYILHNKNLQQITEDQSEVWQLYKTGQITKDDIQHHPRNNILTMAMGVNQEVEIQQYECNYNKGDIFLICSDGLTDMINEKEITKILNNNKSLNKISSNLIKAANKNGGKDNITAIVISV
ncbi:MAG: Stp1/IreP family PP2C-type Ser/Thr phosphatase [Bacteroidales bacterium]|nr:Stp1/IreP family PP2C-type Ser/Thr phosphatase [Bacteroidales bacterium]